jgi:hypothetical protein
MQIVSLGANIGILWEEGKILFQRGRIAWKFIALSVGHKLSVKVNPPSR